MALARKKSRRIVVDGEAYRWTVSPDDEPGIAIVAERFENPARRLVSWFDHGSRLTPKQAAAAIRVARATGWDPSERGTDYVQRTPTVAGNDAAQCDCCDYFSFAASPAWDVCPVCFWEATGQGYPKKIDVVSGNNGGLTLREARANFESYGACAPEFVDKVIPAERRSTLRRIVRNAPN